MSDLQILHITLRNLDGPLPIQAVRLKTLRPVFYQALGGIESPVGNLIHSFGQSGNPEPAPYSIGPIFKDGVFEGIRITTLQHRTLFDFDFAHVVYLGWLDYLKPHKYAKDDGRLVKVGSARMEVANVEIVSQSSYERIWEDANPYHGLKLRFEMPTRFPLNGQEGILPIPLAVWQYYLLRWNAFSALKEQIPFGFKIWVEHQVKKIDSNLETALIPIEKNDVISGTMGTVAYKAFREDDASKGKETVVPESQLPKYLRAWRALAMLAEYCGTGKNAMIGMGRTSFVSFFEPYEKK